MSNRVRRRLLVTGTVQGVGFRPFVYRIAVEYRLGGSVRNRGDAGVEIVVEGEETAVAAFSAALLSRAPLLAKVLAVAVVSEPPIGEEGFRIAPSDDAGVAAGAIPPDTAVCAACVGDLRGETKYHGYWATSCTDCGPRFTVIEGLPYDRPRTSMREFPLCSACQAEYTDPLDRRYHAETTACPVCGPGLAFDGQEAEAIQRTAAALRGGLIVAIKGLGGTHLACLACDDAAVERLRERLGRSGQPLAVMAREEDVESVASPTPEEWDLLRRRERPIVVVRCRDGLLAHGVAPGLDSVGLLLPYSGLQILLLDHVRAPIVLTSANLPGRPMWIENREIEERSRGVADHILTHDRRIVARCDDSVMRRAGGRSVFIRRSRGYTPERLPIDLGASPLLALGPEACVTFAVYDRGAITLSQHIGSVDNLETFEFLLQAIDHLTKLTGSRKPQRIACDLHPHFMTSQWARDLSRETGADVFPVQHHAAHVAAVMAEHRLQEAVGVVLDGYGYGADGTAWGGEIFVARDRRLTRAGSLRPVPLPGGDLATRYPLRVAAGYLAAAGVVGRELEAAVASRGLERTVADAVVQQIARGVNVPQTTSAGRFLDAVAAWLGVCRERSYEGEPAMRLEAAARLGRAVEMPVDVRETDGRLEVDLVSAFATLVQMGEGGTRVADLAATAQALLARGTGQAAIRIAAEQGLGVVCLSGGVAVNDAIASEFRRCVEAAGLDVKTNEWVPCGDGGVSFGQAAAVGQSWEFVGENGVPKT